MHPLALKELYERLESTAATTTTVGAHYVKGHMSIYVLNPD